MWKIRGRKTTGFFYWFFHASGMDLGRFFHVFFTCKRRRNMKNDLAKKLTKHWPWRQNQESAFSKILIFSIILVKNYHFLATSIQEGFWVRFGRVWGPPNPWFLHFLTNFFKIKIESFFGRSKNRPKMRKSNTLTPFGGRPGGVSGPLGKRKRDGVQELRLEILNWP